MVCGSGIVSSARFLHSVCGSDIKNWELLPGRESATFSRRSMAGPKTVVKIIVSIRSWCSDLQAAISTAPCCQNYSLGSNPGPHDADSALILQPRACPAVQPSSCNCAGRHLCLDDCALLDVHVQPVGRVDGGSGRHLNLLVGNLQGGHREREIISAASLEPVLGKLPSSGRVSTISIRSTPLQRKMSEDLCRACSRTKVKSYCRRSTVIATTASISANWSPTHLRGPPEKGMYLAGEQGKLLEVGWREGLAT